VSSFVPLAYLAEPANAAWAQEQVFLLLHAPAASKQHDATHCMSSFGRLDAAAAASEGQSWCELNLRLLVSCITQLLLLSDEQAQRRLPECAAKRASLPQVFEHVMRSLLQRMKAWRHSSLWPQQPDSWQRRRPLSGQRVGWCVLAVFQ
jgi:hypothetical protein